MNSSFRVSLLYLLLVIPQHGNSPLHLMESWMQKDQDDGFVQRDMTNSLTGGGESFGSAHQTYQNSLIRKKKSDSGGSLLPSIGYRKFASKYDRNELYQQPNPFFDGRYVNEDFSPSAADTQKSSGMFVDFDRGLSVNNFHARTENLLMEDTLPGAINQDFKDYVNIINNQLALRADSDKNLNPLNEDYESSPTWSVCKRLKDRYPSTNLLGMQQEVRETVNVPLENSYSSVEDDRSHDIRNREYRDTNAPEGKNPQVIDENEYYDAATNPVIGEENDYNSITNNHAYKHKREGSRQQSNTNKVGDSEASKVVVDALRSPDNARPYNEDSLPIESVRENMNNAKVSGSMDANSESMKVNPKFDTSLVWKLNTDLQSQALTDVMRNTQRALQEVQQFQQKLRYKPQEGSENEGLKRDSRTQEMKYHEKNINFDEKRLKREDEDEQKNMKTGTDEGGGGEYEDEEGKGHKDEEEYYEDADLSDDESGNEVRTTDELSRKYVKREVSEENSKISKEEQAGSNSQDYELSLENAPVENSEKSRKSSFREGEKTKKKSVRKGVKIWDQWGKWSPCSVTCGVGRSTRWRHCIGGGCAQGEKEAQIKRCTNPAC